MSLPLLQINAFSEGPFSGNPAAVVLLEAPIEEQLMQQIAAEKNLSETAFLLPHPDATEGRADFALRWFTPTTEVELCGHATLAAAEALRHWNRSGEGEIRFATKSGILVARLEEGRRVTIDLPVAAGPRPVDAERLAAVERVVDGSLSAAFEHRYVLAVLDSESEVRELVPRLADLEALGLPLIVTARSDDPQIDFVSRFFAPTLGVFEDPVTGSAHCQLVPFWASEIGRAELDARQLSGRRGHLRCRLAGDRVHLSGTCQVFLEGKVFAGG